MGNQMFIYACARSLAQKRNLPYCLSNLKGIEFFDLAKSDQFNSLKFIFFRISNLFPFSKYKFFHFQDNRLEYFEEMLSEQNKNVWYYGYFQGEKYLFDNDLDIRNCFRLKPSFVQQFTLAKNELSITKKIFAVHIRLRDYKTFGPDYLNGPDMTLPFGYYSNLLKENYSSDIYQLIFLSDDIKSVKNEFQSNYPEAIFSDNSPIVDFQFLMEASVSIISHSSFAWWASWLNPNPEKRILVPEFFLGFKVKKEYPIGIIPHSWEKKAVFK